MTIPSWVHVGAVCECSGEGLGNLLVIRKVHGVLPCVWLERIRDGYPLGWQNTHQLSRVSPKSVQKLKTQLREALKRIDEITQV